MTSRVGIAHILGEEASRALILLKAEDESVQATLTNIIAGFGDPKHGHGFFCCATCSVALWRHLSVSPLKNAEERIAAGVNFLSNRRDGNGKWKGFPFYYTLLALSGFPRDLAQAELHYVAPTCERLLKRPQSSDRYGIRRHSLLERVLEIY